MLFIYVRRTRDLLGVFIFLLYLSFYGDVHTTLAIYQVIGVQHVVVK